jgi:CubicO group peptidase (beta-lactamase class C family)
LNWGRNLKTLIEETLAGNFSQLGELGASVSIWKDGRELISLAGGFIDRQKTQPWTDRTPILVYSATKGPAAACVLHCLESAGMNLLTRVAEVWPEFAQAGKEQITMGGLLSHQAGLSAMTEELFIFDYPAVTSALARQAPLWPLGTGHGYHPRTYGFLLDEIVRRLCGIPLGEYWDRIFRQPMELEFWIGLPTEHLSKVATIFPPRHSPIAGSDPFSRAFADPDSLTFKSFCSPRGLPSVASMNSSEARMAAFPAFGGIGTASALGKFYAMLANGGEIDGNRFFQPETLDWMIRPLVSGLDKIFQIETSFSAGFMKDPCRRGTFGLGFQAFGHPGAGGSLAFADPEHRWAFAYVMNQMESGVLPNERALRLVKAASGQSGPTR